MTTDELIAMAREAGFVLADTVTAEALDRFRAFAALVAARERDKRQPIPDFDDTPEARP